MARGSTIAGADVIVKVTQCLIDDGWIFIDNGTDIIERAINEASGEEVYFDGHEDLKRWIYLKSRDY